MWWTLSPYLFQLLCEEGISEEQAISTLITWANTGNAQAKQKLNLQGLEYYNQIQTFGDPTFVLSNNPNGASHMFANMEAHRLIEDAFVFRHALSHSQHGSL